MNTCPHEHFTEISDASHNADVRVVDVKCDACGHIFGIVEHIHQQTRRSRYELPALYLKKWYKVPCTCKQTCGFLYCRTLAAASVPSPESALEYANH